jgi:phenylalanyl-tRNA synthetase alpha chain
MKMYIQPITKQQIKQYLEIPDLTASKHPHAVRLLCDKIIHYMQASHTSSNVHIYRKNPVVTVKDNYDKLLISQDNISRSSTYTHYVDKDHILRTHTTAQIPGILDELAQTTSSWHDVVILLPGLAYRRDVTDKKHVGQVHMLEMWRIVKNSYIKPINKKDLLAVVKGVANVAAPNWRLRIIDSPHPYTKQGIEVNAVSGDRDIEILECGLIHDQILANAGLDPAQYSGWALGMGLDRLVMTLKDIPDIRYLRSTNPKIAKQMKDLSKYREVSRQPAILRDMSYSVPKEYVEEDINEDIREALGNQQSILESVEVLSETAYENLPPKIQNRLGISENQKNVLVRISLRHLERTITNEEANQLYDRVYSEINKGSKGYLSG